MTIHRVACRQKFRGRHTECACYLGRSSAGPLSFFDCATNAIEGFHQVKMLSKSGKAIGQCQPIIRVPGRYG